MKSKYLRRATSPFVSILILSTAFLAASTLFMHVTASGQVNVLTQRNDMSRTGANLNETILNTANVNVNQFGKLFSRSVDGYLYAQPLIVSNLTIPNKGTHNVVYLATEHNTVYAFDADDPTASTPLWQINLGPSVPSTDIAPDYMDLIPEIGITGTPVINLSTNTIYVVAKTKNLSDGSYHQKLHALDIQTGLEKPGSPVEITATVPGTGTGSQGGTITFNPFWQLNRPGLLLLNGVVYIAFGSHGDLNSYHGWVLGYNTSTLQQVAAYNTTADGEEGAIWQAGQGLAGDANNNLYFITGNGTFDLDGGGKDAGNSFVKLSTAGGLSLADWFTPSNQQALNDVDSDLGSGGPLLLPGTSLVVGVGKDGRLRLVDTNNMGHFNPNGDQNVQEFQATNASSDLSDQTHAFMGTPIYWNSPNNGPVIYIWGGGDTLKAYKFVNGRFQTTPVSQSTVVSAVGQSNSVPLSLSANGNQAGTGILWSVGSNGGDATHGTISGIVRAFDATDLTRELWNSGQNAARDDLGNFAKFCPPTVANGKVYVATFSGQLQVFGLLPSSPPPPPSGDVVLYASEAPVKVGNWFIQPDATAAGGARLWNPDAGAAKILTPQANPSDYFEMTFTAQAGVPYHLWLRGKAENDSPYNDSVYVQFSDGVDGSGAAVNQIGTTSATTVNLEEYLDYGLSGWGWQDNGWGVSVMGPNLYFQTTGTHRLRVQVREDGLSIDQIVLSPQTYLNSSPGALKNDTTILPKSGAAQPAPTVTAVNPNNGTTSGGTAVTITGTNFVSGATVSFGGTAATNVNVASATSITATTPAHAAGAVNVVVTNPDGQSATLAGGYTYTSPETVLLTDDFNASSLDTSKWIASDLFSGYTDPTISVAQVNQHLSIGPLSVNAAGSHYNGIRSLNTYDFTGAYCYVQLVAAPSAATQADAMLTLGNDVDNYYRIYVEAGALICQKKTGGTKMTLASTSYNSTQHQYQRIRHDLTTGRVIFETAPDQAGSPGVWSPLYSESWATAISLTNVVFELKAGTWRAETSQAGTILYDNFRVAKP